MTSRRRRTAGAAALALLVTLTACSASGGQGGRPEVAASGVGHVHALATTAGGETYLATHTGLYLVHEGQLEPVGQSRADLMSFTITGPGRFLASGHPAPAQDGPTNLGLTGSTDAGLTWAEVSLGGLSDFHALSAVGERIYGFDATSSTLRSSIDGGRTWREGAQIGALDLDVDPVAPHRVLATTSDAVMLSSDGGATFARSAGQPPEPLVLIDHVSTGTGSTLIGLDAAGVLWRQLPRGWTSMGRGIGTPEAFWAADEQSLTASAGGAVYRSTDGGAAWEIIATLDQD